MRSSDFFTAFIGRTGCHLLRPPTEYDGNLAFNEYVDETHGLIKIFEVEFKPSEVLFQMEPETYRVYLTEFKSEADAEESSSGGGGKTELAP